MVEFGRLYLDGGHLADRPVVPAAWVAEATSAQVATGQPLSRYGYQWWVTEADGHAAFAAVTAHWEPCAMAPRAPGGCPRH